MNIGFVGCGNMATAIIKGIIANGIASKEEIFASAKSEGSLEKIKETLGVNVCASNSDVVANADIIFLAVKPQFYQAVIKEIAPAVSENKLIITIAPGKTISWLTETFGKPVKIVRTMPNTPALVGEGMTGACRSANVTDEEYATALKLLGSFGVVEDIPETMMDVCVAVSGSSPAYVYMFIEAMADGAVADGMPRDLAYKFAAQSVLGSAKMVLETGEHPGALKDAVCSPGGTTIEAVRVLEEKGLRSCVMDAMKACVNKAKGM